MFMGYKWRDRGTRNSLVEPSVEGLLVESEGRVCPPYFAVVPRYADHRDHRDLGNVKDPLLWQQKHPPEPSVLRVSLTDLQGGEDPAGRRDGCPQFRQAWDWRSVDDVRDPHKGLTSEASLSFVENKERAWPVSSKFQLGSVNVMDYSLPSEAKRRVLAAQQTGNSPRQNVRVSEE